MMKQKRSKRLEKTPKETQITEAQNFRARLNPKEPKPPWWRRELKTQRD